MLKIDEKKKPIITAIAILAIVGSIASMFFTQCERRPKVNMKPYLAIGQVMAEETSKLLNNQGEIVVIAMDTKQFKMPTVEAQLKTFQETLRKQGSVKVLAIEPLSMSNMGIIGPEMGMPAATFLPIAEKYPNAAAFVSFVGAPALQEEDLARLGERRPKIIAFCSFGMGLKSLFERQIIHVAIVPHLEARGDQSKKPDTLRDWFNQYYKVVTPETASSLPY